MSSPTSISMSERLRMDYAWTARQKQVLELMMRGRSNTEIAEALGLSLAGAKWHVSEILSKLQADSRDEAADYWRRYNGLSPRFARVFRGLTAGIAGKWVAAAGAVVAIGATAVLVAAALNDGSGEPTAPGGLDGPSPTSAPATPTPQPDISTAWLWDSGQPGAWVWLEADETHVVASFGDAYNDAPPAGSGEVALIDAATGKEAWRFQSGAHAFPAALTANRVVFGTADGTVYGLDRATGREAWRRTFPGVPFEVVAAGPVIVVADADPESAGPGGLVDKSGMAGRVWALDPDSGGTRWETQVGDFAAYVDYGNDTIVVASATGRDNNEFVALRPGDGERIWRVTATSTLGRPLVLESSVITPGPRLAKSDLDTAFLQWAAAPENGGTFFFPTLFGETVASMTNTGRLEVRSISDGKVVAAPEIGDCAGEPLAVGTRLFVLACGALRAWEPTSSGLVDYMTPQGHIQSVATARGLVLWSSATGHSGVKVAATRP